MPSLPRSRPWGTFPLLCIVEDVAKLLATRCRDQGIETTIDVAPELLVTADPVSIRRAVEHLMRGAVAAMPEGGSLVATAVAGANGVELEIADTGAPLSDEGRLHAFDPSGTTERGASGWELALVRRVAELHGGRAIVANCPDGGVAFTLQIPRRVALEAAA
jgi:signal transduction histidine kinase